MGWKWSELVFFFAVTCALIASLSILSAMNAHGSGRRAIEEYDVELCFNLAENSRVYRRLQIVKGGGQTFCVPSRIVVE